MKRGMLILLFLCLPVASNAETDLQVLDKQTTEEIRSACHGYLIDMLPDVFKSAKSWLYENSPVCQDLRSQGESSDVAATLRKEPLNN